MIVVAIVAIAVLGRALLPRLERAGHDVRAPGREELDLFDAAAVRRAVGDAEAVYHLATRIPPPERRREPDAWRENDRLREEASRLLVDAALAAEVRVYVQPTVTFVYPDEDADEDTPLEEVAASLESALTAEREAVRFADAGRCGVVLRLGLLDGPGTGNDRPRPAAGATLHVEDAGRALFAALTAPTGIYNVNREGERVSNERFKRTTGWRPER
jgi:2-alkyl-3-oxoalkanoate reductase